MPFIQTCLGSSKQKCRAEGYQNVCAHYVALSSCPLNTKSLTWGLNTTLEVPYEQALDCEGVTGSSVKPPTNESGFENWGNSKTPLFGNF